MEKILVTGATGNLGKATIDFLLKKGVQANQLLALVRDESKAKDLKSRGIELRIGDYDDYASLVKAFHGSDKLLLISASDLNKRIPQHENAVNAAIEAGVKHIFYTSFERKNETDSSPIAFIAKAHLHTEEKIRTSGMTYTFFRNNLYMDALPMFLGDKILEQGIFFPAGQTKSAFALRLDMAEAIANVITGNGHENKEYALSNNELYSIQDMADELGIITDKKIPYTSPDVETYTKALTGAGVPAEYIGLFVAFAEAIKQGEFETSKTDLQYLLGRKPVTLKEFLTQVYGRKS